MLCCRQPAPEVAWKSTWVGIAWGIARAGNYLYANQFVANSNNIVTQVARWATMMVDTPMWFAFKGALNGLLGPKSPYEDTPPSIEQMRAGWLGAYDGLTSNVSSLR